MRYRVIIETYKSGRKAYFLKRRFLFFFWVYESAHKTYDKGKIRMSWESGDDVISYIKDQQLLHDDETVEKREYINLNL